MPTVTFKSTPVSLKADLPSIGSAAPEFTLTKTDMSEATLSDFKGKKVILNIFPSVDTGVCAQSVRTFNKELSALDNTVVLCISKDLPFAQARFCGAEGLDKVVMLADYKTAEFVDKYGILIEEGPLKGLLGRSLVVINEEGKVTYTQIVPEITSEPDYQSALDAL